MKLTFAFGTAAADATTVALVTINQQALFFNQINDGAKASADKNRVKLVIFNANNQAAAQNSAIEDYITQDSRRNRPRRDRRERGQARIANYAKGGGAWKLRRLRSPESGPF